MSFTQINGEREFFIRGPIIGCVPPSDSLLIHIDEKEFSHKLTGPSVSLRLLGEIAAHQLTDDNPQEVQDTYEAISRLGDSRATSVDLWYLEDGRGLYFTLRYPDRNNIETLA